jgi:hypothetical protein
MTPEEIVAILDEAFGGRSSVAEASELRGACAGAHIIH